MTTTDSLTHVVYSKGSNAEFLVETPGAWGLGDILEATRYTFDEACQACEAAEKWVATTEPNFFFCGEVCLYSDLCGTASDSSRSPEGAVTQVVSFKTTDGRVFGDLNVAKAVQSLITIEAKLYYSSLSREEIMTFIREQAQMLLHELRNVNAVSPSVLQAALAETGKR